MRENIIYALLATLGTWLFTAFGAAVVIFFKKPDKRLLNVLLGFASGVMIAASFWSLLGPAVDISKTSGILPPYFTVTAGFATGAFFIWLTDKTVNALKKLNKRHISSKDSTANRILMLILSITMHTIPEGLAVGVAFGALSDSNYSPENLMAAISVAIGIAIQNFPEGAAVSLPLMGEGVRRRKSFFIGQATGIVEPVAGVLGASLVVFTSRILPFALSFAAGAMIFVTAHELIPECQKDRLNSSYTATFGIVCGFAVMTLLDIMLG